MEQQWDNSEVAKFVDNPFILMDYKELQKYFFHTE